MALVTATPFIPVDVVLKDGSTVRLRRASPDDMPALLAFYAGLSKESLYFRFFHATGADPEDAERRAGGSRNRSASSWRSSATGWWPSGAMC